MIPRTVFRFQNLTRFHPTFVKGYSRYFTNAPKLIQKRIPTTLTLCTLLMTKQSADDFDKNLRTACENGKEAINDFFNKYESQLCTTMREYQKVLRRQIDIINEASEQGVMSNRWDDLPEFRLKADELNQEITTLISTLHALQKVLQSRHSEYITQKHEDVRIIDRKVREIESIIRDQLQEIKHLEKDLICTYRISISKSIRDQ